MESQLYLDAWRFRPGPHGADYHGGIDPDYDGFVRAVCAEPLDVTCRGAFADWLEEHGRQAEAVIQRLWMIDPELQVAWDHEADEINLVGLTRERLERVRDGLPGCPVRLVVWPSEPILDVLTGWPWPFGLYFEEKHTALVTRYLPRLPNLHSLGSYESVRTAKLFNAIAAHEPLVRFHFGNHHDLTQTELDRLAVLPNLSDLTIGGHGLAAADFSKFRDRGCLRWLSVHGGRGFDLHGIDALSRLETLELVGRASLSEAGVAGLTASAVWSLTLHLAEPNAAEAVDAATQLRGLQELRIYNCPVDDGTMARIGELSDLEVLAVSQRNGISLDEMDAINIT
ncbi:MAG: TIGR02996 domain-containing protein, partial [Fimbriiglobus sp.]